MRVVAGSARGRRLVAPRGTATRPTSDRVRESVFDLLASRGGVEGDRVLDLFAGTGAMGIEALSRGASEAVFVEWDRGAAAAIEANLRTTGLGPGRVVRRDVRTFLAGDPGRFDLAFCDPPYGYDEWDEVLERVPAALVVVESGAPVSPPPAWESVLSRRYGTTVVALLRNQSER
jgi:16S rRNA (guanine966-N2)-methyltransferase